MFVRFRRSMLARDVKTMKRYSIRIKETIATIICEERYVDVAYGEVIRQRKCLEDYVNRYPDFGSSLIPVAVGEDAPAIVRHMAWSSSIFGSGPMSAVAGAIAHYTLKAVMKAGAGHVIIDNGGDIAMKIDRPVTVGIFSGQSKIGDIGLRFNPGKSIIGICTSSGTVGHSFSFGCADAVTVIAGDALIADAAATVVGNAVKNSDRKEIRKILNRFWHKKIEALMVIVDDVMGFCGNMPELVETRVPLDKISMAVEGISCNL
jgi:ApbE superfamily uncharacterized protein (UPF0280 family)